MHLIPPSLNSMTDTRKTYSYFYFMFEETEALGSGQTTWVTGSGKWQSNGVNQASVLHPQLVP